MPSSPRAEDVVVLAGGLGTRIRAVLGDTPKVLAPVGGRSLLALLLAPLAAAGFRRVILALGWQSAPVLEELARRAPDELEVVPSVEPAPCGTAGALRHALPHLRSRTVAAVNGDTLVRLDWERFFAAHASAGAAVSIAVAAVPDAARFGTVESAADGAVTRFAEKGQGGAAEVSAGCYVIERAVLESIPAGESSLERDVLPRWIGRGLFACRCVDGFLDIGTPDGLARAGAFLEEAR